MSIYIQGDFFTLPDRKVEISAHSKYRTISSITKDVQKVNYNLRTKGEFVQELYYNREFQIMYESSTLLFNLL